MEELNIVPANNIQILEPVGYFEMIWLLSNSQLVVTDSGGLQKEAFFFKKPCITVRDETEWVELVQIGSNYLTGHSKERIINTFNVIRETEIDFSKTLYGKGDSGQIIVEELLKYSKK